VKRIPLADEYYDVILKAQRGLCISDEELARRSGIEVAELKHVLSGEFQEPLVRKLARPLFLDADALVELGKGAWYPPDPGAVPGLACFNTSHCEEMVNSFLVWEERSSNGVCFDTGADATAMIRFAAEREIRIQAVLLTHTHIDHVADLERLTRITDAKAFASKLEEFEGVETFEVGRNFRFGGLIVATRLTSGHSRGGVTYVVHGLPRKVAIVGDAIFAGSMGGGLVSFADALRNNSGKILTLPDDTILCPGHGPLTTVAEEKVHNPFFADRWAGNIARLAA
jgi:hydroxyacylglutathione hydrolase